MASGYPKRNPFHAQRVIRAMTKAAAAQEIGASGCWLVALIAAQEDAKRYTSSCTWFNGQLLPLVGARKWETLDATRKAAVSAGWLVYEAPPYGSRSPGTYWTNIPSEEAQIVDAPCDETDAIARAYEAGLKAGFEMAMEGKPYPISGDGEEQPYPKSGYGAGYGTGYGHGELSNLSLSLNTRTPVKAAL